MVYWLDIFCCIKPFLRLVTISYLVDHRVIPCIFILTKNKEQITYVNLFRLINSFGDTFAPRYIKKDFEKALINAISIVFPSSRISGCLFHLGQAIRRKIENLGLMSIYRTDRLFKFYTRALCALSYVPYELKHVLFDQL